MPILLYSVCIIVYISSLLQILFDNKEQLLKIKHNRGIRNFNGLPVHGQRTKTNAKTKKRLKQK